jgi:pimeloyl-ACP methyl ester carboxylesterase
MSPSVVPHPARHAGLLKPVDGGEERPVDAVIVPAGRSAEHSATAAALAAELGSALLVLCSRDARAPEVAVVAARQGVSRCYAVDVPTDHTSDLLAFPPRPAGLPELGGRVSLSRKRNLALLVARLAGWRTVLLLDDDIRAVDADRVRAATRGLDSAAAVGFAVESWPDNSVVCHANRMSGADQGVFVGGSALLLTTDAEVFGHFPTIYNEDWLFLFDAVVASDVRLAGNPVDQLPYNPFRDIQRGRDEEFGEVIAEGLLSYAHEPGVSPVEDRFWRDFLPRRRAFIGGVIQRLNALPATPGRRTALNAARAAERQHELITSAACTRFIRHWRAERRIWKSRWARLPPAADVAEALRRVGLQAAPPTPRRLAQRAAAQPPRRDRPAELSMREVIRPTGRVVAGSSTLAVIIPGFLDSGSWPGAASLAAQLHRSGRTALSFDPRGTWSSPGRRADIAPSQQVKDVVAMIGTVPPHERVVLIGHSLGAYLACLAAADDIRVTDVVAIMPPRCFVWPGDYDPTRDTWARRGERRFTISQPHSSARWHITVPHSVVSDALNFDLPATLAALRRQRILFVAGRHDTVVPPDSVQGLYEKCGASATLKVLPVGHDYRDHPNQLRLVNRTVLEWLDAPDLPATHAPARSRSVRRPSVAG